MSVCAIDQISDTLFVVPCSQRKSPLLKHGPLRARDAYTGQVFRIARRWIESIHAKWCILSGGYGFIWPDTLIEDYDCKIEPVSDDMCWIGAFDAIKQKQYGRLVQAQRIVVLGSRLYAENAAWLLERKVEAPFSGMPIGKMLAAISAENFWMNHRREAARA